MTFAILSLTSLFSVINPIGAAPLFVSMTRDANASARRATALRACLAALLVLLAFEAAGSLVFALFGITVPAFQIAGGLLFTIFALRALDEDEREVGGPHAPSADPSVVPLGIPTIAGPGAISTVMVLVGQAGDHVDRLFLALAVTANIGLTLVLLLAAPAIVARIGTTGQRIVAKLMGLMTAVIGVQFVIDGVRAVAIDIIRSTS